MEARINPRTIQDGDPFEPVYVVWELTMRCDHACSHCGSRAVRPRPNELTDLGEMLEVCAALAELGTREVTLIGGEAYLHPNFFSVASQLSNLGIKVAMQSGGRGITPELARACRSAGLAAVGISIDGPEEVHDVLRASPGSHRTAVNALRNCAEAGMGITSNCQVNRLTKPHLRRTIEELAPIGIQAWRAQLTTPMGRAADRPDWILQPYEVLEVIDELAEIQTEIVQAANAADPPGRILNIQLGNNLGYYGPHEALLRSRAGSYVDWYKGCQAGRYVLGIESDGKIKGCPSLPTAPYVGGNVRDRSIKEIWDQTPELKFTRTSRVDELWGFCKTCMYAEVCQAGCSFHTHSTFGRRGNNPFCYHRARTLKKEGVRERIEQVERAEGLPYDFGRFEIIEEPWPIEAEPREGPP